MYICYMFYEGARGISGKRCAHCQRQWAQCGWHRGRQCSHLLGSCRVWKMRGKIPGAQIRLAGPTFPRGGGTTNPIILIYKCYIWILLINTNSLIYICYILHEGARGISEKGCARCQRQWAHVFRRCREWDMHGKDLDMELDFQKQDNVVYCWILQSLGTPVTWQAWVTEMGLSGYMVTCDNQVQACATC